METDILENYRKAGRILAEVLAKARPRVELGASLLDVANFVEDEIQIKGRNTRLSLQHISG